ncbi:MAG: hypothetical protein WD712_01310 [Candidatus Spechtbacterales bacterium]
MASKRSVSPKEITPEQIENLQTQMQENQISGSSESEAKAPARAPRASIGNRAPSGQGSENPFFAALNAAKRITTRRPHEEQPEEFEDLQNRMDQLNEQSRAQVVFRLVVPVLSGRVPVQSLFAAARTSGQNLLDVGFKSAKLRQALEVEGLNHTALANYGTEDRKIIVPKSENGKEWLHVNLGNDLVSAAAEQMRNEGRVKGARVLMEYFSVRDEKRLLRQARHANETSSEASAETAPETTEAAEVSEESSDS